MMNYIERALQAIRSPQTADGTVLKDKDLYNDNAYISVYKEHIEATSLSGVEKRRSDEAEPEAATESESARRTNFTNFTNQAATESESVRSTNFTNFTNLAEPSTAPAVEPDLISVRYVFEDEGAPTDPVEPPAADEPLGCSVGLDVPGVGTVFLVDSADEAERLNLPAGRWLSRADMESLTVFSEQERIQILRIMAITGARVAGVTNLRRKQ
jgi:hypothetical protein